MTCIGQTSHRVIVSSAVLLATTVLLGLVPWRLVAAEPKEGEKAPSSAAEKTVERKGEPLPKDRPDAEPKDGTEQAKVIAEIEKLGGKVTVDEKSPDKPAVGVDLQGTKVTDAGLQRLEKLFRLQELSLEGPEISDIALEHVKALTALQYLTLLDTKITDAGLAKLTTLPQLGLCTCGARRLPTQDWNISKDVLNSNCCIWRAPKSPTKAWRSCARPCRSAACI